MNNWYEDLERLTKTNNDVFFIKTETGCVIHISINNETFCSNGAKLISYFFKIPLLYSIENKGTRICNSCLIQALQIFKNSNYRPDVTYMLSFRCDAIIKVKGKGKKVRRCLNKKISFEENFCTQHNKCFLAYINKYISVSNDVSKLICKLL